MRRVFRDREEAGKRLSETLAERGLGPSVVLGIPRGGVIVAEAVAAGLGAPLDVVVPRKIGAPQNAELAVGAIAPGVQVWDERLIDRLHVPAEYLRERVAAEEAEIARRTNRYRGGRPALDLRGTSAVVVDDGLATGATAVAAIRWTRARGPRQIVLAVPVAPPETVRRLETEADETVVLVTPENFRAVGEWYELFGQTRDEEVVAAMARSLERE
jgi:putative phosphoribosyl transferase